MYKGTDTRFQMKNYGIVLCDLGKKALNIRLAIDLTSVEFSEGQHYGLITNDNSLDSIVGTIPNPQTWRTFGKSNAQNWLSIKEKNLIVIFLLFGGNTNIFDVFKKEADGHRHFTLTGEKLLFLQNTGNI